MKEKFYCFACGETTEILHKDFRCPYCGEKVFEDDSEMLDYLLGYDDKAVMKEPFDKPKKFKEN